MEQILTTYEKKSPNILMIIFAVLLTSLGFITFIFSTWAQEAHISRVLLILVFMILLYIIGNFLYKKGSIIYGVSFIVLSYIVFGTGMYLVIYNYEVSLYSAWPFFLWGIVGLFLYVIYEHKFLYIVSLIVATIGQVYSALEFSNFHWLIFLLLLFGFSHYAYHQANTQYSYAISISFAIQMMTFIIVESIEYYWLIIPFLLLYLLSELLKNESIKLPFKYMSLLSVFLLGMFQVFLLQEQYFIEKIKYESLFFLCWFIVLALVVFIKWRKKADHHWIDLILFLPIFYLPFPHVFGLIILFLFSIVTLLSAYKHEVQDLMVIGMFFFLLSTFTAYFQYAWDTMNKSLFFFIGGTMLFVISFFLERKRKTIVKSKGEAKK